jgi:hypothetical protein
MYRVTKLAVLWLTISFLCALLTESRPDSRGNERSWLESYRDKGKIFLRSETLDARELARKERASRDSTKQDSLHDFERSFEEKLFLVHLNDASDSRQRRAVESALGCQLKRYIPHNTFIVRMSSSKVISQGLLSYVRCTQLSFRRR